MKKYTFIIPFTYDNYLDAGEKYENITYIAIITFKQISEKVFYSRGYGNTLNLLQFEEIT